VVVEAVVDVEVDVVVADEVDVVVVLEKVPPEL